MCLLSNFLIEVLFFVVFIFCCSLCWKISNSVYLLSFSSLFLSYKALFFRAFLVLYLKFVPLNFLTREYSAFFILPIFNVFKKKNLNRISSKMKCTHMHIHTHEKKLDWIRKRRERYTKRMCKWIALNLCL